MLAQVAAALPCREVAAALLCREVAAALRGREAAPWVEEEDEAGGGAA